MKSTILSLAAIAALALPTANAETPIDEVQAETTISGWTYRTLELDDENADGLIALFTADAAQTGVMFTCNEASGLGAAVSTRPLDFNEAIDGETRRARWRTVWTTIAEEEPRMDRWKFLPSYGIAEPREESLRRTLYNAAILGQGLRLSISGRADSTIALPPIDDAFREFHRTCPVTRS